MGFQHFNSNAFSFINTNLFLLSSCRSHGLTPNDLRKTTRMMIARWDIFPEDDLTDQFSTHTKDLSFSCLVDVIPRHF